MFLSHDGRNEERRPTSSENDMRTRAASRLLLAATLIVGCRGNSESTGPTSAEITGSWRATSWEYVAVAGSQRVDLMTLGDDATLVLNAGGSGSLTRNPAGGGAPVSRTFTWSRDGGNITLQYAPGNDDNFGVSLTSGTLRLTKNGPVSYDVNGDGTGEAANWSLAFVR